MQIQHETEGDVTVLTIDDHLDTATAPLLETKIIALIESGVRNMVIDCAPLSYVNSAGLKVLLLAAKRLEPIGGKFVICALTPNVQMIFDMIGFTRIMNIAESRDDALQRMKNGKA